jgi:hypothetical protein
LKQLRRLLMQRLHRQKLQLKLPLLHPLQHQLLPRQ